MDLDFSGVIEQDECDAYQNDPYESALDAGAISNPDFDEGPWSAAGYDGYIYDDAADLSCVRFRWYDGALGRWMTRDPLASPRESSTYRYVLASPVTRRDPSGLRSCQPGLQAAFGPRLFMPDQFDGRGTIVTMCPDVAEGVIDLAGRLATARGYLSARDRKGMDLFLDTQECILRNLINCLNCSGTDPDEVGSWIQRVTESFMDPLLESLEARRTGMPFLDPEWSDFFLNLDSGEYDGKNRLVGAGMLLVDRTCYTVVDMGIIVEPAPLDADSYLFDHRHRVAHAMMMVHINYDLRDALREHGLGDDKIWKCVGDVVDTCSTEHLAGWERCGRWMFGDATNLDVSRIRDEMRDSVREELESRQP